MVRDRGKMRRKIAQKMRKVLNATVESNCCRHFICAFKSKIKCYMAFEWVPIYTFLLSPFTRVWVRDTGTRGRHICGQKPQSEENIHENTWKHEIIFRTCWIVYFYRSRTTTHTHGRFMADSELDRPIEYTMYIFNIGRARTNTYREEEREKIGCWVIKAEMCLRVICIFALRYKVDSIYCTRRVCPQT